MVSFAADSATTATTDDVGAAATVDGGSLKLDSIPTVDIRLLSQSELYSLSLCCSSSFDPHRCDDVVIPKIDRSVFNESAGSRKQTYSRLRLASPSSSPIPILRRRTPHLRSTAPNVLNINNNTDPENAENSHIITLLKELFYSDVNPDGLVPVKMDYSHASDELVPVRIDYSHSPPPAKLPSLPLSYASVVGNTSHKRKRGRPRKKELFENGLELAPVQVIGIKHNVEGFHIENETDVRENLDDRDKEFVNRDGVAVDFVDLGRMGHPFWEEIMHRTQGLKSEEEFLGFLGGLDGQWGSRRKKRRIVDAREFGSALPIGWKLLLSIKKRNGRVWLYCRRYISPSGRQFMSCNDVSSYLLALHGAQIANSVQQTGIVPDADKLTSVAIADHLVQDDQRKENLVSITSPPAFTSESGYPEMQISINPDLPKEKVRKILHCNKCNMTFSGKDELLQHQSSLHRKNRNKIGVRITDGVIIKEGKYECQFCHKTFSERHRYNGHVGTHVRYQPKIAGESEPHCEGEFLDPIVPVQDNITKGSLEPQRNNVAEICYEVTNDGPSACSPGNKDILRVGDSEKVKRNMSGVDEPSDIVITTSPCSGTAVFGTHNENNSFCGASDPAYFTGGAAKIIDDSSLQRRSGRCSPLQFHDETRGVMNSVITNFASAENLKQDMASEISLFNPNNNAKSCDIVLRNADSCQTKNEQKLSEDSIALNELVFDSFRSHGVRDRDIAVNEKQFSNFEKVSCENASISHIASTSVSMVPKPIGNSTISMLAPYDGKACAEAHVPCSIGRSTVDETLCFGSSDKDSSVADDVVLNRHKQMQYGISSVIPYNSEVSNHEPSNPGVQNTFKSVLFALSGHENNRIAQNNYGICGRKDKVLGNNQNFGIGELSDPFRSGNTALNLKSVTGIEQCRNLEDCSGFSSATDAQLFSEDNIMRGFSGALEEHRQEPFEGILLGPSSVSEVFDKTYRGGGIYTAPPSRSKFSDVENTRKHELSLSFGNLETKQLTDSNKDEQERYQGKSFGIESSVQETYGLQTHITSQNSNTSSAQKQGKSFGMDFLGPSFNTRKQEHDSFNMGHLGRDWNGPAGTSGQNIIVDFGNGFTQTPDSVKIGSPWRTGNSDVLQVGFVAASNLQDPSSKCFRTFDLTSDKGEEGSFGVNETFDFLADATSKTVPVEYSFMDEPSSNSVPGESKIFPYEDVGQGLDPSFWLGNDNLMTNTDGGHLVTSICVWCRNVFYHEPSQTRMQQTGAIGSMCPSCSNRIPGQFNVL